MKRRFSWCWLVDVPDPTVGHTGRIHDQVFIDGTYTTSGCLILAATLDRVIAWHWCKREPITLLAVPLEGSQDSYS